MDPHLRISFLDAETRQPLRIEPDAKGEDNFVVRGNKNQKYVIYLENTSPEDKSIYVSVSVDKASYNTILPSSSSFTVQGLMREGLGRTLFVLQLTPTELQDKNEEHIEATPDCCRVKVQAFWFVRFADQAPAQPAMSGISTSGNNVHMPYRVKGVKPGISSVSALGFEMVEDDAHDDEIRNVYHEAQPFLTVTYRTEANRDEGPSNQVDIVDLT